MDSSITTLLAYFKYNSEKVDGRGYLYHEFPEHYVYVRKQGWKPRIQRKSIGRMYSASPFMGERYYLRLPPTVVRGATSFEHLRTVDAVLHLTFKAACVALRLLEDDGEWMAMFSDAREFMTGHALRQLFAMALQFTTITNPLQIWETFALSFGDDLSHLLQTSRVMVPSGGEGMEGGLILDYGLYHIQQLLNEYGKSMEEFGLPQSMLDWQNREARVGGNALIQEEQGYDMEQERELSVTMRERLNEEQGICFRQIVAAVESYDTNPL